MGLVAVAVLWVVGLLALMGLGQPDPTRFDGDFGVAKEQGHLVLYQCAGRGIGEATIAYGDGTGADGDGPVLWRARHRRSSRAPSRLVLFAKTPGYRTSGYDLTGEERRPPMVVDTLNDGQGTSVNVSVFPIPTKLEEGSLRTGGGSTRLLAPWLRHIPSAHCRSELSPLMTLPHAWCVNTSDGLGYPLK